MKRLLNIVLLCVLASMAASCLTHWYEPIFTDQADFHNLTIPSDGERYEIPFEFKFYKTRTTVPICTYQIRCRIIINDLSGEIYDASLADSPVAWFEDMHRERESGVSPAYFRVEIPANDTSEERNIAVQISIDNMASGHFHIYENDEHDWGEWITILDGTQAGR